MSETTVPDITLPEKLQGVELVRSVRTPARMEYTYTAGGATTRFLQGIAERKILGERAPGGKVYVPSRGADPELGHGHRLGREHADLIDLVLLPLGHQPDLHAGPEDAVDDARFHG